MSAGVSAQSKTVEAERDALLAVEQTKAPVPLRLAIFMPQRKLDHFLWNQKRMHGLIKSRARQLVAASTDDLGLGRLFRRIDNVMGSSPDERLPRFSEPLWSVDCCAESESRQGPTPVVLVGKLQMGSYHTISENLFGEPCDLTRHHAEMIAPSSTRRILEHRLCD